jgi:hypothetical protein
MCIRDRAKLVLGRPPVLQPGDAQTIPFAVNLDGMEFDKAGAYVFVIAINGTPLRRLPFRVLPQQNLSMS